VPAGPSFLADRLRANLRAADIPVPEADVERLLEDGSFASMAPYVRALRDLDDEPPPDFLGSTGAPAHDVAPDGPPARGPSSPEQERRRGDLPDTILDLAPLLRDGVVSPVEVVERSLSRIAERDGRLNAFQLVLDERARESARRAEGDIRRGEWRGPLHGVPMAVKDLFDMAGLPTTAGSVRASWTPAAADAQCVRLLERAGAIVVGKTRLPEYAFWPGSRNPHYGPTANPHDLERDAGGSSSGSAAAVADGMVYAALGSDTGGSIRIPAALCGVVGLKPTHGRVSLEGCVPLAWSLDHAGPLARTTGDAAVLFDALTGGPRDNAMTSGGGASVAGVSGMRVGVLGEDGAGRALASSEALEAWRASLRALEDAGARLVDVDLAEMAMLRAVNFLILSVEAATYHAPGLRGRYGDYGEPCRSRLLTGFAYDAGDYVQAQRVRRGVRLRWGALFERVDVLSTPSQPDVAPPLGDIASVKFTSPFNAMGWPAISVPFGSGSGRLPLATQLVAAPGREATLLRVAGALERARQA